MGGKKLRKIVLLLTSIILAGLGLWLLWPRQAQAQMLSQGMMGQSGVPISETEEHRALPEVLKEVLQSQQASTLAELDCQNVTDEQWEELGDAVMGQMHPDTEQHEAMDEMMGGEGSESLRQVHIRMGQNYLGCARGNLWGQGMMGGFGRGMMGGGMWGMMGAGNNWLSSGSKNWQAWGWWHIVLGSLTWILFIALLVATTRYLWRRGGIKP